MRVEEREGSGLSPPLPNGGGSPQNPHHSPLYTGSDQSQTHKTLMPSSTQNQIANLRTKGQRWVGKNKQTSLRPMRHPRRRIIDIALPDAGVRDEQYLDGTTQSSVV